MSTYTTAATSRRVTLSLLGLSWALLLASPAWAVDGFGKLKWGMQPEEVRANWSEAMSHDPRPKYQPKGAVGGRLVFSGTLFESKVEASAYFTSSGLDAVRLQYKKPRKGDVQKLIDYYSPYWGAPVKTTENDRGRKKRTWSWPWEGVELRQVTNEGDIEYQRVDFSHRVQEDWQRADAQICTILPKSSSCKFADSHCRSSDPAAGDSKKEQPMQLGDVAAKISCNYGEGRLVEVRLTLDQPDEAGARWLRRLLERRLGEATERRQSGSRYAKTDLEWGEHQAQLRLVRRARIKKSDGSWTGPLERVRFKRTVGANAGLAGGQRASSSTATREPAARSGSTALEAQAVWGEEAKGDEQVDDEEVDLDALDAEESAESAPGGGEGEDSGQNGEVDAERGEAAEPARGVDEDGSVWSQ